MSDEPELFIDILGHKFRPGDVLYVAPIITVDAKRGSAIHLDGVDEPVTLELETDLVVYLIQDKKPRTAGESRQIIDNYLVYKESAQ